jgi:hypothetical protein
LGGNSQRGLAEPDPFWMTKMNHPKVHPYFWVETAKKDWQSQILFGDKRVVEVGIRPGLFSSTNPIKPARAQAIEELEFKH